MEFVNSIIVCTHTHLVSFVFLYDTRFNFQKKFNFPRNVLLKKLGERKAWSADQQMKGPERLLTLRFIDL